MSFGVTYGQDLLCGGLGSKASDAVKNVVRRVTEAGKGPKDFKRYSYEPTSQSIPPRPVGRHPHVECHDFGRTGLGGSSHKALTRRDSSPASARNRAAQYEHRLVNRRAQNGLKNRESAGCGGQERFRRCPVRQSR